MEVSEEEIRHRQELFCMTVKSCFLAKITKYQNLLRKHVHIDNSFDLGTQLSDDEIELVLGASHKFSKHSFSWRNIGRQLSTAGLFRWVLTLIQKIKARRILSHLSNIPNLAVKTTILEVSREIAVAYEYQVVMLYGDEEVVRLAQHAVSIFITYLNQQEARFTQACLLQALLEVKPTGGKHKEVLRTKTATWNNESVCLKWKLGQIFKQPGLRILIDGYSHETDLMDNHHDKIIADDDDEEEEDYDDDDDDDQLTETLISLPDDHPVLDDQQEDLTGSNPTDDSGIDNKNAVHEDCFDEVDCAAVISDFPQTTKQTDISKYAEPCHVALNNVSSIILGQHYLSSENGGDALETLCKRRISTLDMDFEQGTLNINDYQVELNNDFSPLSPDDSETFQFREDGHENIKDKEMDLETNETKYNEELQTNISEIIPNSVDESSLFTDLTYPRGTGADLKNVEAIGKDIVGTCVSKTNDVKTARTKESLAEKGAEPSQIDLDSNDSTSSHICAIVLSGDSSSENFYKFYGCFTPFGAKCQPSIYGFRGPLQAWDDNQMKFTLIYNDQVSLHENHCNEISDPNCFHQKYQPKTSCIHK